MSRKAVRFHPKEGDLRRDVRVFGAVVGDVIREQGGSALFELVESARRGAIQRREGHSGADESLRRLVAPLGPAEVEDFVRAFSMYFQVVNLVETVHRIRRRRDYLLEGLEPQPGSLEATVRRLRAGGLAAEDVTGLFGRIVIEPVFTAHPTQAVRRAILEKHQRIARKLVDRLDPSMTPAEDHASLESIRSEITIAWQTEEHPPERPRVMDELEYVVFYLTDVLYRIVPPFYEELEDAVRRVYGGDTRIPQRGALRFASWVGGDMDGNPNVNAHTIRAALARHRKLILGLYRRELSALGRRLSQSGSHTGIDPQIPARIAQAAATFPAVYAAIPPRRREMYYAVFLRLVTARIEETARGGNRGYGSVEDLLDDLRLVEKSLLENRGRHAGLFALRRALRRVETFGFHLAALDVRQDARVHRAVVGDLLGDGAWAKRAGAERRAVLLDALARDTIPRGRTSALTEKTLEVFRAIGECASIHGAEAIGPYIVSMATGPDDVLSVLLLARWSGLIGERGDVPLDVAPLFETVGDLEAAPRVMTELLSLDAYRSHLRARGNRQVVMVGYSDSNKDGGIAASRWAIQRAQANLVAAFDGSGVDLTIFHGRGGTISRGGGKTHRAVLAFPPGAVRGRLRVTEQGEMINAKYGLRGIALRTLERSFGAVALATASTPPADERWDPLMDEIAREARRAYRALVHEDPLFREYFRAATPIDVIERMAMGSRPPSRRGRSGGVEDLRAIPWVFAWMQSRHLLPGWYGLGTGIEAAVRSHGEERVASMAREWPFARALLDDVEMVLAKADMPIAARYAELADGSREIFERVRAEYDRTVAAILRLKGSEALLDGDVTLQRSIRLRNPYVDPMSFVQVELLRRWRASGRRDKALLRALLETVHGIAQGLQNTG